MAVDTGFDIRIDTDNEDDRTRIVLQVLQALAKYTRTTTYNATYSAGTDANQTIIKVVATGTVNVSIRVHFDSAVVGADEVPEILRKILQALSAETLDITHGGTYTAGNGDSNVDVVLT